VQGDRTGRANLEAAAGATAGALLADFAIATAATGVPEVDLERLPARHRVASRDLRTIFAKLHESYGLPGGVPRPHPVHPLSLGAGAATTGTMRPGTFVAYRMDAGDGVPTARLRFAIPDGSPFPASSGAQVAVLRIR
jgi:hypothetical protein